MHAEVRAWVVRVGSRYGLSWRRLCDRVRRFWPIQSRVEKDIPSEQRVIGIKPLKVSHLSNATGKKRAYLHVFLAHMSPLPFSTGFPNLSEFFVRYKIGEKGRICWILTMIKDRARCRFESVRNANKKGYQIVYLGVG